MAIEQRQIKRPTTGSIFRLLLTGTCCSIIPFSLLMGILSIFGAATVTWNGEPLNGLSGFLASPFIGLFISLFLSGLVGLFTAAGLWLHARFRPLTIHYWPAEPGNENREAT